VTLTAIDDGRRHQDTRAAPQCTHHVGHYGQQTQSGAAERSGSRDNPFEFLVDGCIAVTGEGHTLVLELFRHVSRTGSGHLDPGLGKDGAGGTDEGDVDDRVERVGHGCCEGVRGGDVVRDPRDGAELRWDVLHRLMAVSGEQTGEGRLTSQTPRSRTRRLSGNREDSIWLTRNTLLVKADSSMIGMLDV